MRLSERPSLALKRRVETLHRKAEELFAMVIRDHGEESSLSDFADNIMLATQEMAEAIDRKKG